jgi:hypothetical protein
MNEQRRKKIMLGVLLLVWVAVAAWAWSAFQAPPRPFVAAAPPDSEIAFFLQEVGPVDVHLEWLDRGTPAGAAARDLFSTAPISSTVAAGGGAEPAEQPAAGVADVVPAQPTIAAALRYMGYVETAGGTLALLREGSQMYLAREGNRVGPGYLVAIVDESFVEIEFKGARRRLPVSRQEGDTNGR